MANENNLKPWKPGQSGNMAGKPKGSKHLSTWIQDMLNDENFSTLIRDSKLGYAEYKGAPLKAILNALIIRSVNGDIRAFEILCKYGYGTRFDLGGSDNTKVIPILALVRDDMNKVND